MTTARRQHQEYGPSEPKPPKQKHRIQIEVEEEFSKIIDDVMERCSIRTYKDFYAYATTLFVWAVEEAEAERIIGTAKDGQLQQFQMPPLLAARAKAMRARAA